MDLCEGGEHAQDFLKNSDDVTSRSLVCHGNGKGEGQRSTIKEVGRWVSADSRPKDELHLMTTIKPATTSSQYSE
jgi:hypothetical protein